MHIYWLKVAADSVKPEPSVVDVTALFVLQKYSGGSEWSNGMQMNSLCMNMTCLQASARRKSWLSEEDVTYFAEADNLFSQNDWLIFPSKISFL